VFSLASRSALLLSRLVTPSGFQNNVRWALLLLYAYSFPWLQAAVVDLPAPGREVLPLGGRMEFISDPTGRMELAEAQRTAGFAPAPGSVPAFGFVEGALWGRCVLRNVSAQPQAIMVELEMSRLSHLEWYVQAEGLALQRSFGGSHDPGERAYRFPSVNLTLAPGQAVTVYCRIASDTAIWLPFVVGTEDALWRHRLARDGTDYIYFGFGLALAGLGFGLAMLYRRMLFLYTALLPLAYLAYYWVFFGYYQHWPWGWPHWVGREGVIVANAAVVACFLLFIRSFLQGAERAWPSRLMLGLAWLLPGLMLVFAVESPFKVAIHFSHAAIAAAYLLATAQVFAVAVRRRRPSDLMLAGSCLLVLLGVVWLLLQWMLVVPQLLSPVDVLRWVSVVIFVFSLLACVYAHRAEQVWEARLVAAQQATAEAQYTTLRAQLNPHFLLNTLNSIDALSHDEPRKIPELVQHLAAFLRRSLVATGGDRPTLGEEVAAIRNYLEIEQVRYADRLTAVYDVSEEAAQVRLPEFLLQPLVENALKHGFKSRPTLTLRLVGLVAAGALCVRVENMGQLTMPDSMRGRPGVGVENVRLRLNLIYGEAASFDLRQADEWVRAEIRLPLL
jgi:hypothetical protein